MSFGSPADLIPFTRFLDCRHRRHRIAAADATVAMPASTDGGVRPDVTETSNDDDGVSPRVALTNRPRGAAAQPQRQSLNVRL